MKAKPFIYVIPSWCGMSSDDHHDGIGGCWGISSGLVAERGELYCDGCEYYQKQETVELQSPGSPVAAMS